MRICGTAGAGSRCAFVRACESCGSSAARSFSWTLFPLEFFFLPPSSCSLCRVTGSLARQYRSLLKSDFFGGWERASWFCLRNVTWAGSHLQDSGGSGVCWWLPLFPLQHHRQLQARGATVRGSNFRQQHSPPPLRHPALLQRTDASVSFVKPAAKKIGGHGSGLHRPVFTRQRWTVRDPAQVRDACALFTLADCALNFGQLLPADHLRKDNSASAPYVFVMLIKYLELALLKSNTCNQIISRRMTKSVCNWSFLLCAFLFCDWHRLVFIKCTFLPPCNPICCSPLHMCEAADNYLTGAEANIHYSSPFYI